MMIDVRTDEWDWHFIYRYRGWDIHVQIEKGVCSPATAMARATWEIHDAIRRFDERARSWELKA